MESGEEIASGISFSHVIWGVNGEIKGGSLGMSRHIRFASTFDVTITT